MREPALNVTGFDLPICPACYDDSVLALGIDLNTGMACWRINNRQTLGIDAEFLKPLF